MGILALLRECKACDIAVINFDDFRIIHFVSISDHIWAVCNKNCGNYHVIYGRHMGLEAVTVSYSSGRRYGTCREGRHSQRGSSSPHQARRSQAPQSWWSTTRNGSGACPAKSHGRRTLLPRAFNHARAIETLRNRAEAFLAQGTGSRNGPSRNSSSTPGTPRTTQRWTSVRPHACLAPCRSLTLHSANSMCFGCGAQPQLRTHGHRRSATASIALHILSLCAKSHRSAHHHGPEGLRTTSRPKRCSTAPRGAKGRCPLADHAASRLRDTTGCECRHQHAPAMQRPNPCARR